MMMKWNANTIDAVALDAATRVLAAAKMLQNEDRKRRGTVNPPPYLSSAPRGEYPRLRSGSLRSGIVHDPTTPREVLRSRRCRVGYLRSVFYGAVLESRGWLGVRNTAADIRAKLEAVLGSSGAIQ